MNKTNELVLWLFLFVCLFGLAAVAFDYFMNITMARAYSYVTTNHL